MLDENEDDKNRRLFGNIDDLVEITIEGKKYQVPVGLELLRCFQFLKFNIAFEHFCWNASCDNCVTPVTFPDGVTEDTYCCQETAEEGMVVPMLPAEIEIPEN